MIKDDPYADLIETNIPRSKRNISIDRHWDLVVQRFFFVVFL